MASDDDRSVAADSWSIKSDYGSTLDDEQRFADTAEVLLASSCHSSGSAAAPSACSSSLSAHHSSDFSFDKDVPDVVPPMLGLQSYHDGAYVEDLANYNERSHADDWFGTEVMDVLVDWTKNFRLSNTESKVNYKSGQSANRASSPCNDVVVNLSFVFSVLRTVREGFPSHGSPT